MNPFKDMIDEKLSNKFVRNIFQIKNCRGRQRR